MTGTATNVQPFIVTHSRVGEHSIIDGDCDMMGEALRSLENERKTFVQSVQNMYNLGLDTTQIAQITNRSIAEIEALLDEAG